MNALAGNAGVDAAVPVPDAGDRFSPTAIHLHE